MEIEKVKFLNTNIPMKNKEYYKTCLEYIKNHNLTIFDCLKLKISNGVMHFENSNVILDLKSEEEQYKGDMFYRLIFLDIMVTKSNFDVVLEYILKLECLQEKELIIFFSILKRVSLEFKFHSIKILQRCKMHLGNKNLRSLINRIIGEYTGKEYFYDLINVEMIIKYNLWSKTHLISLIEIRNFVENGRLVTFCEDNSSVNIETRFKLTMIFFSMINSTSFKFIKKYFLSLEKEFFIFLPVTYTRIGYYNLKYILSNIKKEVKIYIRTFINKDNPLQILFDGFLDKELLFYGEDEFIRSEYLKFINTFDELENFLVHNQFLDYSNVHFFENFKQASDRLKLNRNTSLSLYNNIVHNMCMSPIVDRRFLGCKILCFFIRKKFLDVEECEMDVKNLIFDHNIDIRRESKFLIGHIKVEYKLLRDVIYGQSISKLNIVLRLLEIEKMKNPKDSSDIIDILTGKKNDILFSCDISEGSITLDEIINEFKIRLKYFMDEDVEKILSYPFTSLLRVIYVKKIYDMDQIHLLLSKIVLKRYSKIIDDDIIKYSYISLLNKILKESCYFFYENNDFNSLIYILLQSHDLGILIEIEDYLKKIFIRLDDLDYKNIIDHVVRDIRTNSVRIRKSGGYSIIFKSVLKNVKNYHSNLDYILDIFLVNKSNRNIQRIECSKSDVTSTEDIEYHYSNVLVSLMEEFEIFDVKSLFKLCFNEDEKWFIKNNSMKIFKILFRKYLDSKELRDLIYEYVEKSKATDHVFIYLILLIYEQYDELYKKEIDIIDKLSTCKGFIGLKCRAIKNKNHKLLENNKGYVDYDIIFYDFKLTKNYNYRIKDKCMEIYQEISKLEYERLIEMLSLLSNDHKKYKVSREFFFSIILKVIDEKGCTKILYQFLYKIDLNQTEEYDSHYIKMILDRSFTKSLLSI